MKQDTVTDWNKRVSRVIDLVTGASAETAGLEQAAAEAASSPWHFHRCFKAATGESFAACLRRLRLERSAFRLKEGTSVIDAALEAGFSSPEAFCRIFTSRFGINPSKVSRLPWWKGELAAPNGLHWRAESQRLWFSPAKGMASGYTRLIDLPAGKMMGLHGSGDYWKIPSLWDDFTGRLKELQLNPSIGDMLTVFDQDGAFRVGQFLNKSSGSCEQLPPDLRESELPGGRYAVTVYFGPGEGIGPFWDDWRKSFFPSSGWMMDAGRPSLEWYQNSPSQGLPELGLTLLCDPICSPL